MRNLRGSKMEDVIFAGSDLRKPTNLCEVSLVLDNSDHHLPVLFDEVTVTRRVFRNGDSEYLINRQPCRLKDIHELFMDTGLGRDAYSIIGQGKIEEMLSTRPEDRRGPFEDAAGIVKFKHRRKEAERKLDETQANLVRVEDILAELEQQLGPLAQERERAERYQHLADALEEGEITLLVVEIDRLNERFKQASEAVLVRQSARDAAAQALAEVEEAWRKERDQLDEAAARVDALQTQYVQLIERRQKAQGDLALIEQQMSHLQTTETVREQARQQQAAELTDVEAEIEKLQVAMSDVEARLGLKSGELEIAAEGAREGRKESISAEIDNLNADFIDANHRAATLRNELKMLAEQAASEAGKRQRYEEDVAKWQAQVEQAVSLCAELELQIADVEKRMEACTIRIQEYDSARDQAAAEESNCVSELHRVQGDLQALRARLELLKDLEEGYDGYALGVKTVLQQASRGVLKGIHGSLAELIRVDKRFELAIETALGGALQNVVVGTEVDARAAIQLLKQRQAGRATFMPLDVIKSRRMRDGELDSVRGEKGYVGIASDLVDASAAYRVAVEHLLGNVIIAETLEDANMLARKLGYRNRIVTIQGDVVSPGGIMSGGHHNRKGPGLLGRSRERQDVEARVESLERKERELTEQQVALRQRVNELQDVRRDEQVQLEALAQERQSLQGRVRDTMHQKSSAEERIDALKWESHQLQTGRDAIATRSETAKAELEATEQKLEQIAAELREKRAQLATVESELVTRQEQVTSLRIEVATLRQERDTLVSRKQELLNRQARLMESLRQLESEVSESRVTRERLIEKQRATQETVQSLLDAVAEGESQMESVRRDRLEREAEVRRKEEIVFRHRQQLSTEEELLHRSAVTAERADADLAHALEKMGEAHGMTYEWAKTRYPLNAPLETLEKEVQSLRRQIAALGDVNLGAIEEHERLSERVGFLVQQRDDLVGAQEQLEKLIDEIDTEMSQRFMDTFRQIQAEFAKAFQVLFNGGEADLSLTNPDDPLTTGIEVVAKPPGKRLQNLNLLSGGERALTAMALLFAILRVRPVPFCVLDEVEAALDEANVARFAQQLKLFAAQTQFIVITHRRGTMEEADALYGVTMPEKGVSSMVSVRLTDDADYETA